jgi:hypothetical protein
VEPVLPRVTNGLFTVESHYGKSGNAHVLTRIVGLKKTRVPADSIGVFIPDKKTANTFSTSRVSVQSL